MLLKVIGAGFGRTGTLSLKHALDELGFGPCYHMMETRHHPDHDAAWIALARGETQEWQSILTGYQSIVDWPGVAFWKMLVSANPDAKVILTVRDPARWYESADKTIFSRMRTFSKALERGKDLPDSTGELHMRMVKTVVADQSFGGRLDRENAISVFNTHNEEVRHAVPPERLLIYESGEGWERLCNFLDVPVPDVPYPRVNSTEDFKNQFPGRS